MPCPFFFFFLNQNQCFLAAISDLSAVFFRHAAAIRQPGKSQYFMISYASHLSLQRLQLFQLLHDIKELTGLFFAVFSGSKELSNAFCSVQPITLSFHCGMVGRRLIAMLSPKYLQMYLFICVRCLAKLCPYILHEQLCWVYRKKKTTNLSCKSFPGINFAT